MTVHDIGKKKALHEWVNEWLVRLENQFDVHLF